jgi:GNAT superfamily N-acetyltransferase
MTEGAIATRPATEADLEAIDRLIAWAEDPGATVAPTPSGSQIGYLRHLVRRATAAVAIVEREIVGFGATVVTARGSHLADLFVAPPRQGQGIGSRLFEAVFAGADRKTTFGSADPRAIPIYVRGGMLPRWPNLAIDGEGRSLPEAPADLDVAAIDVADLVRLELGWTGIDRTPEIPFWETFNDVRPFAVRAGPCIVAAGFHRLRVSGVGRWIDHAVVAPGEDGPRALLAAIRSASVDGGLVGASLPGPSPLLRVVLDAGFRIGDSDTFMSTEPDAVDPLRELVNTGLL